MFFVQWNLCRLRLNPVVFGILPSPKRMSRIVNELFAVVK